jgi:hypothetical protein
MTGELEFVRPLPSDGDSFFAAFYVEWCRGLLPSAPLLSSPLFLSILQASFFRSLVPRAFRTHVPDLSSPVFEPNAPMPRCRKAAINIATTYDGCSIPYNDPFPVPLDSFHPIVCTRSMHLLRLQRFFRHPCTLHYRLYWLLLSSTPPLL